MKEKELKELKLTKNIIIPFPNFQQNTIISPTQMNDNFEEIEYAYNNLIDNHNGAIKRLEEAINSIPEIEDLVGVKGDKGDKGEQGERGEKGEKGDKGDKGVDGLTTSITVNGETYTHVDGTITLPDYPVSIEGSNNASDIAIKDANNNFKSENVEDALTEIGSQIKDIETRIDNLGESGASGISIQDIANNFTATNVEGALAELFQFVNTVAEELRQISSGGTGEQPLYKFGLLSDVHVDGDGTDQAYSISDLNNAIQYFNNENCKFIVHCGDVTENGRSEDYSVLKSCLATSSIPNYFVRGNHDMTNGYSEATGCADDYTITQNNDLFIFLSPSASNGTLSDNKLNWLENLLTTNIDKRIFFIYHFFFNNTAGNACNLDNGGLPSNNSSVIRLKAMIESYSNLIFCNGHSHLRFNLQDLDPNANYYHEEGKCYYVHVPSTSRPRGDNGSGGTTNIYGGSEGYLVEVYADKVVFKPIDFISSEYLTKYNYTVNVAQGNNVPTEPETPPESSSEVITPTWMTGGISSSSGADITDAEGMRSSYMEFDTNAYTYYITVTNEFEGIDKLRVAIYNPDGSFVVRQSYTSTSLTPGVPGAITFPITSGKFRLKVDFKSTNTLENINNRLVITKVAK